MNPISQVQQDLLGRMEQMKNVGETASIKPAQAFAGQAGEGGFATAFDDAVRAVDAQEHRSGALMAAVVDANGAVIGTPVVVRKGYSAPAGAGVV